MISKTQINKRKLKKRNPEVVETIELANDNGLLELAKRLSGPLRLYSKINLDELNKIDGDKVMVVGKVLGQGEVDRKMNVSALGFSESALDKLKRAGCEVKTIKQELKDNPKLEGVEVI